MQSRVSAAPLAQSRSSAAATLLRPQRAAAARLPRAVLLRRSAVLAVLEQPQPQQQPQQQPQRAAAAAAAPLLSLAAAAAARAADEEPTYAYPAADDPVVTVMFTLALGLLSVVTLGVRCARRARAGGRACLSPWRARGGPGLGVMQLGISKELQGQAAADRAAPTGGVPGGPVLA
jgi:hypothetical protein